MTRQKLSVQKRLQNSHARSTTYRQDEVEISLPVAPWDAGKPVYLNAYKREQAELKRRLQFIDLVRRDINVGKAASMLNYTLVEAHKILLDEGMYVLAKDVG
jgi:hypothetical protein